MTFVCLWVSFTVANTTEQAGMQGLVACGVQYRPVNRLPLAVLRFLGCLLTGTAGRYTTSHVLSNL